MRPYTKFYMWKGAEYTIPEIARMTGLQSDTLRGRLRLGMSLEQAVELGRGRNCKLHDYHGDMLTINEIAARTGIAASTIRERMRKGWSLEDAADTPIKAMPGKERLENSPDPTEGMEPREAERYTAAMKIAHQAVPGSIANFGFRCVENMLRYEFESDSLAYAVSFSPQGIRARLTARYKHRNIESTLNRLYNVSGDRIREVTA